MSVGNYVNTGYNDEEDDIQYDNRVPIPQRLMDDKETNQRDNETKEENRFQLFYRRNRHVFYFGRLAVINLVAIIYFVFATIFQIKHTKNEDLGWCNGYGMLLLIYCFVYGRLIYRYGIKKFLCKPLNELCRPCLQYYNTSKRKSTIVEIGLAVLIAFAIIVFLVIDTKDSRDRLIGFSGVFLILLLTWLFSTHSTQVNWRPVVWGLIIQFVLGCISVRWPLGRSIFECLAKKIVVFFDFAKDGASFIFSKELVENNVFAFTVLPVLFFFSLAVQIMYYLGTMQYVIKNVGWLLHTILDTTACESLHAATTLFLGMPESFLVIEPYLNKLTGSEIHAIMCSGFATTSGTVMAAYITLGAQPVHLITATVMSAPAGLCIAKLLYPETKKSLTNFDNIVLKKSEDTNFIDAATKGALSAIPLVLGIVANIIAFMSAISFLNAILGWIGGLIGYSDLTFEMILAKLFIPLCYVMGVPWKECETVGTLIGLKTIINEFVAYKKLGEFKDAHKLSTKSEAIATFAICGFANPPSLGVMIGSLSTMAPDKSKDIIGSAFRALVGGCAVCFLTASIAGMLINEESF